MDFEIIRKISSRKAREEFAVCVNNKGYPASEVVEAERIEGTRKLLKLQVKLEEEQRQIIAELAHFYEPEELVGKQVIIIANLQPGIIHGERSQGKLLLVHGAGEVLTFATGDRIANSGARVC